MSMTSKWNIIHDTCSKLQSLNNGIHCNNYENISIFIFYYTSR